MITTTKQAAIALQPSGYISITGTVTYNGTSYIGAGSGNTTSSATFTTKNTSKSASTYFTFDTSSIPSGATISSVNAGVKYGMSTTGSNVFVQLYAGTTAKGSATTGKTKSAKSYTMTCGTWTRSELNDLRLKVTSTNSSNNTRYLYFYGADVTINYTYNEIAYEITISSTGNGTVSPSGTVSAATGGAVSIAISPTSSDGEIVVTDNGTDVSSLVSGTDTKSYTISNIKADHTVSVTFNEVVKYTVTTDITNGELISPTTASASVKEGENYYVLFQGTDDNEFKSATINGEETDEATFFEPGSVTCEMTTNYGTYSTYELDYAYDGDSSTKFWSNEAQAAGKYVQLEFGWPIMLNNLSTTSESSTDYPGSINVLQISSDGETWEDIGTFSDSTASTFSNINKSCSYIRIYATGSTTKWLVLNEINVDYTDNGSWQLEINNVSADTQVSIVFGPKGPTIRIKLSESQWSGEATPYKRTDSGWEEITTSEAIEIINKSNCKVIRK